MFITVNLKEKVHQISIDELFNDTIDISDLVPSKYTFDTYTYQAVLPNRRIIENTDFHSMDIELRKFNQKYKVLIDTEDKNPLYRKFKIPKRSGGLREISAPNQELMRALLDLKEILEKKFMANHHTAAFAYVNGRCTVDCVRRHQKNNSRWFAKFDFSKFFPSTTPEFLMNMLYQTYPISMFVSVPSRKAEFEKAMSLCFLNGGLPQGTPTSPLLTNMMMIPIDHEISKMCRASSPHLVYTRYADDIIISGEFKFPWWEVQKKLLDILKSYNAPFSLNTDKTRFGSNAGRNWNLGVMLNKDNKITIGHKKKEIFSAMLYNFMRDRRNGSAWELNDVQHLNGLISYYKMVEGKTIDDIIAKNDSKFGESTMNAIKEILKT